MNSENINKEPQNSDEISLKELIFKLKKWFHYLLSKWVIIFVISVVGGGLGLTYAISKKTIYTAATTFVLEDSGSQSGPLSQLGGLASIAGIEIGGGGIFQGNNILELYKSRTMIQKTLLSEIEYNGIKQLLIDRYLEFNNVRIEWSKKQNLKALTFRNSKNLTRLQDSILGTIVNDINKNYLIVGTPDKKTSIIKIEVKAPDEFFAKAFNDQIVKNVNDFYVQTKTKKSLENVLILQQKVDSVRTVMNGAIYSAAIVADATPNLNPTRQVQRVVPMQRSQFISETNKAILGEMVKNLELSKISLRKETPLIQVVDKPVFPLYKERISKTKGIILGGLLFGFLTILWLLLRKVFLFIINN